MSDVQAKKKKQMLSSYSIVFLVLIVVAILTWFVPQSVVVKNNGTKEIIYNAIMVEGKVVTGQGLQPMGLWDILMAPIRGFVKAAPVGFAILMAGSFLHLMNHVGAMNSAIGWLLKRFTGKALIIVLMFVSALFGAGHYTEFGDWYFDEFAFVFLVGALLLGPINKIPEPEFVREFVAGAREMLGVVLVLTVANGISVIMGSKTAGMSVTFVYWIQNALQGVPGWAFAIAAALAYVGIGFFMQSTSGVAGITMPILGAVAYALFQSAPIGSIGGQVMLIAAFTIGLNFTSAIYPSATNMGTLEIYQIPYDRYLSFMLKIDMVMLIVGIAIVSVAPMLGIL